jgi:hypothetical protein
MFRTNQFIIRRLVLTRSIQYVYGCMSCLVANTLWVSNQSIYLAEFYLVVSSEFHWVKRSCSKTLSHPLSRTSVLLILPTGWVWDPAEVWSVASLSLTHRECHWTKPLFLLVSQDSKQNHSSSDPNKQHVYKLSRMFPRKHFMDYSSDLICCYNVHRFLDRTSSLSLLP